MIDETSESGGARFMNPAAGPGPGPGPGRTAVRGHTHWNPGGRCSLRQRDAPARDISLSTTRPPTDDCQRSVQAVPAEVSVCAQSRVALFGGGGDAAGRWVEVGAAAIPTCTWDLYLGLRG
jgi:hypothetical protein